MKALVQRPAYSASIVLVLAVGFALLSSVLAIVDGVLFKPLGYSGERDLVAIEVFSNQSRSTPVVADDDLAAWADAAPGVAFTGFRIEGGVGMNVGVVPPGFFDVVGIRPARGGFDAGDFEGPRPQIQPRILTDEVFRSQFDGDPGAIGRTVITDPSSGRGYRVVGVMPPGFRFPYDGWPVGALTAYAEDRYAPYLALSRVIARLAPGSTAAALEARVHAAVMARNTVRTGNYDRDLPIDRVRVTPLGRALGATTRPLFVALLAAAMLVVVLAALNASSLMASRSVDRRRELAVRRALGASRLDIGRLLLVEAALLTGAGVAIGLPLAAPVLRYISALLPDNLVLFRSAVVDWRVAGFSLAVTLVLAVLVTIWPLRLATSDYGAPGQERGVTSRARSRSWRLVVTTQVALALVLTLGGSLMVASLLSVYANTPPIATRDVLTIEVEFHGMSTTVGREAPERAARVDALLERIGRVPGVEAVALTAYNLLQRAYQGSGFVSPATAVSPRRATVLHAVTGDFYRVVQPQLVAGRYPTDLELDRDEPVIVVSERVANAYWPNEPALGQTVINHWEKRDATAMAFTVVGVVKDVRWALWDEDALGTFYGPYALLARQSQATLLIRTPAGAAGVSREVVRVATEADPFLRLSRVAPFEHLFVDSVRPRRFRAWLFGSFAFASLFVAGLGIFGQLAMSTARRTREIGIRMTCGAMRAGVVKQLLREQLVPVAAGLVSGAIVAAWAVQYVAANLYQVTSFDARVWASAIGLILLTAAAGTCVPALRASRVDPTEALRAE